jgi:oligopeptide/dipeptide ABC transporter ATP-binding protein
MHMTTLLEIDQLEVRFGNVRAVNGASLSVDRGETVAIVGESGSGKSVTALSILRLLGGSGRITGGSIRFEGEDLLALSDRDMRQVRGRDIGMVFQEPMTSLNPLLRIGVQLTETMRAHLSMSKRDAETRAAELLAKVGIPDPVRRLRQYPHEFSGGMRQRVMIAMALACRPRLIVADEPTTALDVTIQGQILELLKELSRSEGLGLILITHNLGVVARYADWVNVMYAGRIVESASVTDLFARPAHPYTLGLKASIPSLDAPHDAELVPIEGQAPDLSNLPDGCAYAPRCRWAEAACRKITPPVVDVAPGHRSACLRWDALHETATAEVP